MDFSQIWQQVKELAQRFDYGTLEDRRIDPYVFVALIDREGSMESDSLFLTEGDTIHHNLRPHICLGSALQQTRNMIMKMPFPGVIEYPGNPYCVGCKIGDQYLVVTVIAANKSDAEWIGKKIARLFVSF